METERPNGWLLYRALTDYQLAWQEAADALADVRYAASVARMLYERYGLSSWEVERGPGEFPEKTSIARLLRSEKEEMEWVEDDD